jgi:hypothetical protein
MNKNPESKTASEDLSRCINPKKTDKEIYFEKQKQLLEEIFNERETNSK